MNSFIMKIIPKIFWRGNVKIDQIYIRRSDISNNPFEENYKKAFIKIKDVKNNYILFEYIYNGYETGNEHISMFNLFYKLYTEHIDYACGIKIGQKYKLYNDYDCSVVAVVKLIKNGNVFYDYQSNSIFRNNILPINTFLNLYITI